MAVVEVVRHRLAGEALLPNDKAVLPIPMRPPNWVLSNARYCRADGQMCMNTSAVGSVVQATRSVTGFIVGFLLRILAFLSLLRL